jgi:hypothetical protein
MKLPQPSPQELEVVNRVIPQTGLFINAVAVFLATYLCAAFIPYLKQGPRPGDRCIHQKPFSPYQNVYPPLHFPGHNNLGFIMITYPLSILHPLFFFFFPLLHIPAHYPIILFGYLYILL